MSHRVRSRPRPQPRPRVRLSFEVLEARNALSAASWPGFLDPAEEIGTNLTLDLAQPLAQLSTTGHAEVVGRVGNGPAGAADVDFYSFTLAEPARVRIETLNGVGGSPLLSVLSLYNSDLADPLGHRLVAQDDGAVRGGDALLDRLLGAGAYYVAVSGSGNRFFHPFLVDSGTDGSTGAYGMRVVATPTDLGLASGPVVLNADPADGSRWSRSPMAFRLEVDRSLDPATLQGDVTVHLISNPHGTFGDENDTPVFVGMVTFNETPDGAKDVVVTPWAPLAPGHYRLLVAGNAAAHPDVVRGADGSPMGADLLHPDGQDFVVTFQVVGTEGRDGVSPDDTLDTAHHLPEVVPGQVVQVSGVIGDDPTDERWPFNPSDVDIYHFRLTEPGRHALAAEVFAGRIGSPLDPALSLFRRETDGRVTVVVGNMNTYNPAAPDGAFPPLLLDSALFAGLAAGDYYLAVSSGFNVADPYADPANPNPDLFDPLTSHTGALGNSVGSYVLSLKVERATGAPQVVATSISAGAVLDAPPTLLTVRFSAPMDLQQVAARAFETTGAGTVGSVYFIGADGRTYSPRFLSYDAAGNAATFLMLDALPNGPAELVLVAAGAPGRAPLTDLAGSPIQSNDPSGNFVVRFHLDGSARGTEGDPTRWTFDSPVTALDHPLVIGTLFPLEVQSGITIERTGSADPASGPAADFFQVDLIQDQNYFFSVVDDDGMPVDATVQLWRDGGALEVGQEGTSAYGSRLPPGRYVIEVLRDGPALGSGYQLRLTMRSAAEPATSLTVGPMPAVRLRLVTQAQPAPSPDSPQDSAPPRGPTNPPPGRPTPAPPTPAPPTPAPPTPRDPDSARPGQDIQPVRFPASPPPQGGAEIIPPDALLALSDRPLGAVAGPDTNGPVVGSLGRTLFLAETTPGGGDTRTVEASLPSQLQFTAVAAATTEDARSFRGASDKRELGTDPVPFDHFLTPLVELEALERPLILPPHRPGVVAVQPASDRVLADEASSSSEQTESPAQEVVSASVPWLPGPLCAVTLSLLFSVQRFCSRGREPAAEAQGRTKLRGATTS